jgi:hypothetical protein
VKPIVYDLFCVRPVILDGWPPRNKRLNGREHITVVSVWAWSNLGAAKTLESTG